MIGIDLGDIRNAICVLTLDGTIIEERTIPGTEETLEKLAKKYPQSRIAIEAETDCLQGSPKGERSDST